jgi:anaerobic ribonucleoside-triphosphate reductase activating protein
MSGLLNVASLHHDLNTVHPLARASILHLQGCLKGRTDPCPGCANRDLWSDAERWLVAPGALARLIVRRAASPALGVSGGEPLDQYGPLCELLGALRRAGFSLLMWTGFEIGEVRKRYGKVLGLLDVIVSGPYQEGKRTEGLLFASSANQEVCCPTRRGRHLLSRYGSAGDGEIVIPKDGSSGISFGVDAGFL